MMQLYANNATASLSGTLTQGGTTLTLGTGLGGRFPSISGADFFTVTLFEKDVSNVENRIEIVKVTARTADTLTIERDVEAVTGEVGGYAYPSSPEKTVYVELRWTAGSASSVQSLIATHNHSALYEPINANIQAHVSSTSNPHTVTAAQVGLGNVTNTADIDKPVSTLQATADSAVQSAAASDATTKANAAAAASTPIAHATNTSNPHSVTAAHVGAISTALKGVANGVAELDSGGKVPAAQLPSYVDDVLEYANLAALPVTGEAGKIYVAIDTNKTYRWSGSAYSEITSSPGSTDAVTEGTTNKYYTDTRVRATVLTALSLVTNAAITATDTVLSAFGKLQKQITDHFAVTAAHGATGAVVGTTNTQTLTNKTLTAPNLSTAQIGVSGTATSNFSFEPTTAGAMRLARGNVGATTQDVMTVDAAGNVAFPQNIPSYVRLRGVTGYGSTNTRIRRFTTLVGSGGTDITYADSATLGGSFTINASGIYAVSNTDQFLALDNAVITLNDSTPTGLPVAADILAIQIGAAAGYPANAAWCGYLAAGSVIRARSYAGSGAGANTLYNQFSIARAA